MKIVFPWRPALRLLERVVRDRVRYRGRGERLADDASYPTDQGHDYEGCPQMVYAQRGPGGFAAGEVIWTWVAYEEDRVVDARIGKHPGALVLDDDGGDAQRARNVDAPVTRQRQLGKDFACTPDHGFFGLPPVPGPGKGEDTQPQRQ